MKASERLKCAGKIQIVLKAENANLDRETRRSPSRYWHYAVFSFRGLAIIASAIVTALLLATVETDRAQEYLRIGVAHQLIGDFFKLPGLFVNDTNSSLAYKGRSINVQEVNREANMHFNERDDGREIQISPGQTFEISLSETRTAGFRWIIKSSGEPVCRVVKDSFDNPNTTPGQSGTHQWTFMVDTPGAATIELAYRRQWLDESPPARTYTLRIRAGG